VTSRVVFTPSISDEETLRRLFVVRESLLDLVVARVDDAAKTGRLSNTLFVGPRGAGKTFLVSMINHEAKRLPGFGKTFDIAWLDEDPWGITSYAALVQAIRSRREPAPSASVPQPPLTVVIVENFDRILSNLGPDGQRQLRARIEQHADLLLVATSTRLTKYLREQAHPFYGSFDTIELEPFSLDEAIVMLKRIAEADEDEDLAHRLELPAIRARISAISRLAGGQPRMWAILAAGLKADRVDEMIDLLIERFDTLTPYYQEQLDRLSPNELKVVVALIEADGAMTVSQLSEATGIERRSLAKTLHILRPGWVVPREGPLMAFVDKRTTFYQLTEPLARVVLQIKASRGGPIRLALDFLTAWFDKEELERTLASDESLTHLGRAHLAAAALESSAPIRKIIRDLAEGLTDGALMGAEPSESTVKTCEEIFDALGVLSERGDASQLLALSPAIVDTLEARLDDQSPALLQVEVALMAARCGGGKEWIKRAMRAIRRARPDEQRIVGLMLGAIQFQVGEYNAALATLSEVFPEFERLTRANHASAPKPSGPNSRS